MSSLSIADLRDKSADLREMAQTARTRDTRDALLRLAERYAQLAQARMAANDPADGRIGGWQLPPPATPRDKTDSFTG